MLDLGLGPGDRFMRLRQFLHVVDAGAERIMIGRRRLGPEHVQDHLRILGVVLVPTVVQGLAGSSERQRRHQAYTEACFNQASCDRPVIVPRRLEGAHHGSAIPLQHLDQPIMLPHGC